jgi:hypothetical protein
LPLVVRAEALVEVARDLGQRDAAKAREQRRLGLLQRARQGCVDRLLDQTLGVVAG